MQSFEEKSLDVYPEITINKGFLQEAGFGSRAIPTYVREWIVAHFASSTNELGEKARAGISAFVSKYLPDKSDREVVKNMLLQQHEVKLLDNYSVYVNLKKGDRYLHIPYLDEAAGYVSQTIVDQNEMLLSSGIWGVGTLFYVPPSDTESSGQIWIREFQPFQIARIDIEYFKQSRGAFSIEEWLNLLVSSMGFNPSLYSNRRKILLLCRLLPIVEPRYNLVELAPKGTGKSFVYENMSRYVAVRSGSITPAVLFFNDVRKTPGLIARHDCVVIDEAQKVRADTSGELTALLKSYLESGRFGRGSASSISAEAGIVLLANVQLDEHQSPINTDSGLFRLFPNFLQETAFIDRISGLLPGWELPKITKDTPSRSLGLKGDIFAELLHVLRRDISFRDYVNLNLEISGSDEIRDRKAIAAGTTGLLKILFPNKSVTEAEFYEYCVNPALELRQRVRDELTKLDREYRPVSMKSTYPDSYQQRHTLPRFQENDGKEASEHSKQAKLVVSEDETTAKGAVEEIVHIVEGETGHSYRTLFTSCLQGARMVRVVDPYIRLQFQIQNFISFASILDTINGEILLSLVTSAEDSAQEREIGEKLQLLKSDLERHNIDFDFSFSNTAHARTIETDTGWSIKLDRGLDIFQRPESRFSLSEVDQEKRPCKETEIMFIRRALGLPALEQD